MGWGGTYYTTNIRIMHDGVKATRTVPVQSTDHEEIRCKALVAQRFLQHRIAWRRTLARSTRLLGAGELTGGRTVGLR